MSDSCQSSVERNASSSTYSAELSRPSSVNHHGSFFVEDDDGEGPNDEGSRRGISVYLNDNSCSLVPAEQAELGKSTDDSGYSPSSVDQSDRNNPDNSGVQREDTNKEDTAAYRNDHTFSGPSSDEVSQFTTGTASFARIHRPLPPIVAEGSDTEGSEHIPYPSRDKSNDSVEQGKQLLQLAMNSSQFPPSEDLTNITTDTAYQTVESSIINASHESDLENKDGGLNMRNNESRETVSTWVLLDGNEPLSLDPSPPYRQHVDKNESSETDVNKIVRELEREVSHTIKRPTPTSSSTPPESKTSQKEYVCQSPSVLNNILTKSSRDYAGKEISILPSFGNSDGASNSPLEKNAVLGFENPEIVLSWPIRRSQITSRPKTLTYSQVDIALEALRQFQLELLKKMGIYDGDDLYSSNDTDDNSDHDADSCHEEKDCMPKLMPPQRLDSKSIDSKTATNFWQKFSIWRILLLIFICILVPPFFFMIAMGKRTGFPDFRIIKLITHKSYRAKILKGFLCDVDVKWFRWLSLGLGIAETLGVCAGIAVGLGVGLGTE